MDSQVQAGDARVKTLDMNGGADRPSEAPRGLEDPSDIGLSKQEKLTGRTDKHFPFVQEIIDTLSKPPEFGPHLLHDPLFDAVFVALEESFCSKISKWIIRCTHIVKE